MSDINPFQPPSASARALHRDAALPKLPILVMIVLEVVTLGFYSPYWFLSRRRALNRLVSWDPISWILPVFQVTVMVVAIGDSIVYDVVRETPSPVPGRMYDIAVGIIGLVLSFRVKGMLEDIDSEQQYSGIWTFLFRELYLQYKINRAHVREADVDANGQVSSTLL